MSKYLVTLEIESPTNPADWNWDMALLLDEDKYCQVIHTEGIEE